MEQIQVAVDATDRDSALQKAEEAKEVLAGFQDFEIDCEDDLVLATECLKDVKRAAKEITAQKEAATKPMNAALVQVRSWFKPALDVLESTERLIKHKIEGYHVRVAKEAREAMEAMALASQAGDFDAAHEASKGIVIAPKIAGLSTTQVWDYEITDLSKVPREFLTLDHSAVRLHLKAKEPKPIAGLKFFLKGRTSIRT